LGRNITSILVAFIAGLAIIGFFTLLIKNPGSFIISILVMIGIAFLIFVVMRAFLNRRGAPGGGGNSEEMKKYRKAVKQSKQKYNTQPKKPQKNKRSMSASQKRRRRRKSVPYLRVIDGKKSANKDKENDRASN